MRCQFSSDNTWFGPAELAPKAVKKARTTRKWWHFIQPAILYRNSDLMIQRITRDAGALQSQIQDGGKFWTFLSGILLSKIVKSIEGKVAICYWTHCSCSSLPFWCQFQKNKHTASRLSRLLANCHETASAVAQRSTAARPSLLTKNTSL